MPTLYYETSNFLKHHGVKGQKWGVRRYQNPDGTLTAAGKKKLKTYKTAEINKVKEYYGKKDAKYSKRIERTGSEKDKQLRDIYRRTAKKEIQAISRMKLADVSKERKAVGAEYVATALSVVGSYAAISLGAPMAYVHIPSPRAAKTRFRLSDKNANKK